MRKKYPYGDFVYMYYSFVEKFHVEPQDFGELMEANAYIGTTAEITGYLREVAKNEK